MWLYRSGLGHTTVIWRCSVCKTCSFVPCCNPNMHVPLIQQSQTPTQHRNAISDIRVKSTLRVEEKGSDASRRRPHSSCLTTKMPHWQSIDPSRAPTQPAQLRFSEARGPTIIWFCWNQKLCPMYFLGMPSLHQGPVTMKEHEVPWSDRGVPCSSME